MALRKKGFIPFPIGEQKGFDHADVYLKEGAGAPKLYVAHTGADRIEVIDCATNTYVHALSDLPGVAGVLVDSEQDRLFSSDRGCTRVSIYRCSDETLLGRVPVGPNPNGLAYDPNRRQLFVFNLGDPPGVNPTLSVVAVDRLEVVATLPLPGRPRWAVYDAATDAVYVNIQTPPLIAVIDAAEPRISREIAVPSDGPHGLAIDGDRLFCAADGQALVVLNRDSGAIIAQEPLPGAPDVVWHDPSLGRLYVAIGKPGVVSIIDTNTLKTLETVLTEEGAHTLGWVSGSRTLYVFLPSSEGAVVFGEEQ